MRCAILNESNQIENIIIATEDFAKEIGAIAVNELPLAIGDFYMNGVFKRRQEDGSYMQVTNLSNKELREIEYHSRLCKEDGTPLIRWDDRDISVDEANKVYVEYSAEGSSKATEIQTLIVAAKTYIRELYPDK
jgi:hypothetical protein